MNKAVLGLALVSGVGAAHANAFVINEHDAAATGRGNATTATDDSPASIVYNPAGIAVGDGTAASVSATMVIANGSYTDPQGVKTETDSGPAYLPAAFVTHRVNDLVSVGVGFHLPFGLAISWPSTSPQNDVIESQSLRTYFISPVVGFNLGKYLPGLTVAGGVDIVPASVELKKALYFGDTEMGQAHLGGSAVGVGGRVGVQYRPTLLPQLSVGAMWRSSVKLDFTGTGDFDSDPSVRAQLPPDGAISTSLTLPQSLAGGVAFRPLEALELELDVVWMQWSKFQQLAITLPDQTQSVTPEQYKDTTTIRVGVEYKLPAQHAAVRAGYIYDPTPIPDTTVTAQLPDANRNVVTLGGTYDLPMNTAVSLGLLGVLPTDRKTSDAQYMPFYKGSYGVSAFVASVSFAGRFGGK